MHRSPMLLVVVVVFLATLIFGCSQQSLHESRKAGLTRQFGDDFNHDHGPPEHLDMSRWVRFRSGQARIENGFWLMELVRDPPPGPGEYSFGGFATKEKHFKPGLTGTNGVEITVAGFSHEKYPEELNKPGQLVQAWSLTIGSWQGLVGDNKEKDRGVQLHFDLLRDDGLYVYLVRGLLPTDFGKYPQDAYGREDSGSLSAEEKRARHVETAEAGGVYITAPCLALATRIYRTDEQIEALLERRHRYGLYLTNDANTLYWTLDDQVMDVIDITGYFSTNSESVRDGAFLTISGFGGFQRNTWTMDDLEIRTSS